MGFVLGLFKVDPMSAEVRGLGRLDPIQGWGCMFFVGFRLIGCSARPKSRACFQG